MIRPLTLDDADELAALLVTNRDFLAPFEPVRPDAFYTPAGQRSRIAERDHLYGILDGGAIAGTITLSNVAGSFFQSANVGYFVDRGRNGRGLASAALASMRTIAFGKLGLHRLEAGTLVDNIASQRVLEKNGFERIGVAPRYLLIGGAWRDHVLFQRTTEQE